MDWNPIAIGVGILVFIFAILGVVKISKKREAAEGRAEEEHQQDLTDLPKTDGHSYHYSAEEAHRKELAGTPGQTVALKKEPLPKTNTRSYSYNKKGIFSANDELNVSAEISRGEIPGTPAPETSSQILVSSKPPKGVSVEVPSPIESTPTPISKPNKPIRKHRKK